MKKGSVFGSSEGNLTLTAGNGVVVHGSDLVSGKNMTLEGKNVTISSAENSHTALTKTETKSSGLTLGLSGTVGSALNTATQQVTAARKEEDGRLAALKGTQAALTGYQATQAARLAEASGKPDAGNYAGVTVSYGKQKSTSESRVDERTASSSHLQAGGDMAIRATGGDVTVVGSQLQAGRDADVSATGSIVMRSGEHRDAVRGEPDGVSGSVSASRDRMNSNFDSVKEQSGIFAGSGGFDIKLGNHTQLDGGVLASTALAANDQIRITDSLKNWGFSLCYLYLRNVKGFRFNHKCVYRINCEQSLNMRIKPKKTLKRDKPEPLAVPESCNECGPMDFMHYQSSDSRSVRLLNVTDDFNRETLAI